MTLLQSSGGGSAPPAWQSVYADESGDFVFKGRAPGTYRLFAMEDTDTSLLFDSEFLRRNGGKAGEVTVKEGNTSSVTLTEIPIRGR